MKNFLTVLVVAGMLVLLIGVDRPADANTKPQLLTGILNKMEKAHQDLKSLRADLIQKKTNNQIGITDTEFGSVLYKPGAGSTKGRLRIDYTKPANNVISVIGDSFTFYQPRINQALKSSVAKASKGRTGGYAQLIGLDASVKSLAGNYNFDYVKEEMLNGQNTYVLRLTPKSGGAFANIEIWVSDQLWFPVQQKVIERNGDYTILTLKNLQLNANIPDAAFNVSIPSGTKVVDKI